MAETDLIERQAAIETIFNEPLCESGMKKRDALAVVLAIYEKIKSLPSAQPEPQWMPVDLRNNSPEENKVVLLGVRCRDDFKYFVTSRQDYNYWTGLGREIKGELRWQPLPEPY